MRLEVTIWVLSLVLFTACTSVGDYTTAPGECYRGSIIDADYIISETLPAGTELVMTLDADALGSGEVGTAISTTNLLFSRAPVIQMGELSHDSLSLFQFPSGRVINYLAYAAPTGGPQATVVVSLMENEQVEVRLMRPDQDPDDGVDTSIFGVFRLVREKGCAL
jgi:hypothetical protein